MFFLVVLLCGHFGCTSVVLPHAFSSAKACDASVGLMFDDKQAKGADVTFEIERGYYCLPATDDSSWIAKLTSH